MLRTGFGQVRFPMRSTIAGLWSAARKLTTGRSPPPEVRTVPVFKSVLKFRHDVCLRDGKGEYTFLGLAKSSKRFCVDITRLVARQLQERVAVVCPNDVSQVVSQWACWMSGQIAVPLNPDYPEKLIEYVFRDSDIAVAITTPDHVEKLKSVAQRTNIELLLLDSDLINDAKVGLQVSEDVSPDDLSEELYGQNVEFYNKNDALLMYTSGRSGKPKGALLTYKNIDAQISSIISSWSITPKDCVLNARSLYTTEGITASLLAPLTVGGRVILMEKFSSAEIWSELLGVKDPTFQRSTANPNILIGESWMYRKLVEEYEMNLKKSDRMVDYIRAYCTQKIRLMLAMCAPVPSSIHEKWEAYTGHELAEVYTLTEGGVVSTPTVGSSNLFGVVGLPVSGIRMKVMAEDGDTTIAEGDRSGTKILGVTSPVAGTLLVKGDTLSKKYWGKKVDSSWTKDGWFKTGDIVSFARGMYSVLGKDNCDIVKSKSYKVSLLQIEAAILDIPNVQDVAAFHLICDGNSMIAAAVTMKGEKKLNSDYMRSELLTRFPEYAVPTIFVDAPSIPRNHKGSIIRHDIVSLYSHAAKHIQIH